MKWIANGSAIARAEVPEIAGGDFAATCVGACGNGARLAALLAHGGELIAVLADDARGELGVARVPVPERRYPSLSAYLPQAQAFEREVFEDHGIDPEGHPWRKPLRAHGAHPFFAIAGPSVHEVAVGPVHAGVIEPGHFRFQCHGEVVEHLEIQLGYQHRGVERALLAAPPHRRLVLAESIAGDSAIGHALAYAMTTEALASVEPPLLAHALRAIALELERLSNHVGDLGALCNDVGYLPGASYFGRLRGEFLNLLMEISGNRFGRGLVVPGGVRAGISQSERGDYALRLERAERDLHDTAEVMFETASVAARFERVGVVPMVVAQQLGLVGPIARASGCDRDVRRDHPFGMYRFAHVPAAVVDSGDVMARALVRWVETQRSLQFVREQLRELAGDTRTTPLGAPREDSIAIALVEGWRGEIAHVAITDAAGAIAAYKIVDPSFHNWFGLALALRGNQISDFPLCNKSFNLSYAGHDL